MDPILSLPFDQIDEQQEYVRQEVEYEIHITPEKEKQIQDIVSSTKPADQAAQKQPRSLPLEIKELPKFAAPPKMTMQMYFFCMFRKFFNLDSNGQYQELPMNPLPPPMRSMNATKRYENECKVAPEARHAKKMCGCCRKKEPEPEPYWTLHKTIECVWPTLKDSIIYRFFQNGFEFSMPFFMRFYLVDLKKFKDGEVGYVQGRDERRTWLLIVYALCAI